VSLVLSGRGLGDSAVEDATKPVREAYVGRERIPTRSAALSLLAEAAVDVASRRLSFPNIDSITDNSINPARRAESGWVVSSVVSIRSALRSEQSAHGLLFVIAELDFQEVVSGPRANSSAVKQLSGCCSARVVRACQISVFSRQEAASALTPAYEAVHCADQRMATVPPSA
jgi:hypothetical protein